jgi:hypothetical protein
MTIDEADSRERMAVLVADVRATGKFLADVELAAAIAADPANPANWPLSPRLARHAGGFARGYSYGGQPSRGSNGVIV